MAHYVKHCGRLARILPKEPSITKKASDNVLAKYDLYLDRSKLRNIGHLNHYLSMIIECHRSLRHFSTPQQRKLADILVQVWGLPNFHNRYLPDYLGKKNDTEWISFNRTNHLPVDDVDTFEQWKEICRPKNLNFHPIFSILNLFKMYGINYVPVIHSEVDLITSFNRFIHDNEDVLEEKIKEVNYALQLCCSGETAEDFSKKYKFLDFSVVLNKSSRHVLEKMVVVIESISAVKEWLSVHPTAVIPNELVHRFLNHPTTKHLDGSMIHWGLLQFQVIYDKDNGWEKWLQLVTNSLTAKL